MFDSITLILLMKVFQNALRDYGGMSIMGGTEIQLSPEQNRVATKIEDALIVETRNMHITAQLQQP